MNFKKFVVWSWIFLVGVILSFWGSAQPLASENWQELPPLSLQDCIQVDKILAPNPFSQKMNEFWMVLKYEEQAEGNSSKGVSPKRPAGDMAESLNMYLVTGLTLMSPEEMGLPYSFLIVAKTLAGSGSETVHQWLLSDTDNDGKLDKAKFEQIVRGEEGKTVQNGEVDIPADQISQFQDFFEKAIQELSYKAENDPAQQCSVS